MKKARKDSRMVSDFGFLTRPLTLVDEHKSALSTESCKDKPRMMKYTGTIWHKYFTTEEEGSVRHLGEHLWERPIFNLFPGLLSRGHVTSSACGFQVLKKVTGWDTRSSQIGKLSHSESAVPLDVALTLGPSISSTVIVLVWASVSGSWEVLQQTGQQDTYFVPRSDLNGAHLLEGARVTWMKTLIWWRKWAKGTRYRRKWGEKREGLRVYRQQIENGCWKLVLSVVWISEEPKWVLPTLWKLISKAARG